MDYLQYFFLGKKERHVPELIVLNLIINGLPSIQNEMVKYDIAAVTGFKPYYKWITFNTSYAVKLSKLK